MKKFILNLSSIKLVNMARKKKIPQFKAKPNKQQQQVYKDNLALIKKLMALAVLFCLVGCVTPKSCEAYTQCDELYINDYNCVKTQINAYSPTHNTYRDYYPNTQTVYYYPVVIPQTQPVSHSEPRVEREGKRPGGITRDTHNR